MEDLVTLHPARAVIDAGAIRHNLALLAQKAPTAAQLAVVKADAYGHGLTQVTDVALEAGVTWLGVAQVCEALTLRQHLDEKGIDRPHPSTPATSTAPRIFSWIFDPHTSLVPALEADLDLSVSTPQAVAAVSRAARKLGRPALVHLKIDTGMSRAGATWQDFPALVAAVAEGEAEGTLRAVALWSHFSSADDPSERGQQITAQALAEFQRAYEYATSCGLHLPLRHIGATAGILWHPESHFNLVRAGISMYGLSPDPAVASAAALGLKPVMTLQAHLTGVKRIPAGRAASYGAQWQAPTERLVGLVPVGYGDGIDRSAWNGVDRFGTPVTGAAVSVRGQDGKWYACPVVGKVCMDQFIIDLGDATDVNNPLANTHIGDTVVIWGDPTRGHVSVDTWAKACGTINYEVVTRLGPRVPRVLVDSYEEASNW